MKQIKERLDKLSTQWGSMSASLAQDVQILDEAERIIGKDKLTVERRVLLARREQLLNCMSDLQDIRGELLNEK